MAGLVPFNKNLSAGATGFEGFYNMLDDFFSDTWLPRRTLTRDTFKVDVQENEKEYLIEAELPGVKKEEVNLRLADRKLSIAVNREKNIEQETKNYIHKERRSTSVQRSIYLADAGAEGVKAKLEDGVLSISVPKEVKADPSVKINIE